MKKKFIPQLARKFTNDAVLLTAAALALSASWPAVALAESCFPQTTWTDSIGSWFVGSNWDSGNPPTGGTSAQINNGGTATIDSPGANACDLALGLNAGNSGKVSLNGGSLAIVNDTQVGPAGRGTLTITNGASVTAAVAIIAGSSGSVGAVTADGASFTSRAGLYVGGDSVASGGVGLMTITNGGTVTAVNVHAWKSGTITGNGTVSTTSGMTIDGTLAPNWTLTNDGDLTFTSSGSSSSLMQCNVTPENLNSIDAHVTGAATLAGRVSVTMTGNFSPGQRYTLLQADGGRNGTFQSQSITYAPPTECFTPTITYDANHVYLYLQPCTS